MRRLLLVIVALFLSSVCHAQTDTVFWFAVPDLSHGYGNVQTRLVFHTYDQPATVTVEQPAGALFPTTTFGMAANGVTTVNLSSLWNIVETAPVITVLHKGLYIHSTAPITCYFQSVSNDRETYTLKGRKALGTDFQILAPTQYFHNHRRHDIGPSIEIVSTEDSNKIDVEVYNFPSQPDTVLQGGILRGTTFQIVLNRGQSYALRGNHYGSEVIKTRLHATYPIAVNITSDSLMTRQQTDPSGHVLPSTCNLAGEQLLPLPYWGTDYVWINGFTSSESFRGIVYVETGLYGVLINHDSSYFGWNYGNSVWNSGWRFFLDSVRLHEIERPFGVIHQQDPNFQMAATVLPHIRCAGSHKISYLRSDTIPLAVHIIVESHAVGNILFNGDSTVFTPAVFHPVPGLPTHRWCNVDVSRYLDSGEVMTVSCDTSKFLLAVIESDSARGTAYSYLTDYAPYPYLKLDMDTAYCAGDSIAFHFEGQGIDSVAVHGPGGLLITTPPYVLPATDTNMSGLYIIEGFSINGCIDGPTDSVRITVFDAYHEELYDTSVENQPPWNRYGIDFADDADTVIISPLLTGMCDSIIDYHLRIYYNVADTLLYYACESELPVQYGDSLFYQEGEGTFLLPGSHGEDSLVTFILHVIPGSDTTIHDTITESQLPWYAFDTLFTDTVADYLYHLYNEAGCDSTIHYYLFIYWNGDHCDTTLEFPNLVTPNGDGHNDRFVIKGLIENNCFKYNELTIYDRNGHQVYHRRNIATDSDWWDPAARRHPAGTYFYYFKAHGVTIHTQHTGVIEVLSVK